MSYRRNVLTANRRELRFIYSDSTLFSRVDDFSILKELADVEKFNTLRTVLFAIKSWTLFDREI